MVKIFVTGDNHIGKKYDRYPEVKDILINSRFDVLDDMVKHAEKQGCHMFVVTGDLFDNIKTIKVSDVKQVVDILAKFAGNVIVLPGNHDYYTGDEKVWIDFENAMSACDHNITLIKEFRVHSFEAGDEQINIYPAFCQSKHSKANNLEWIKNADIERANVINIGVAHGAIQGLSPDMKEEYFLMTESELMGIPVDAWFIGHTHIPYPDVLLEDEDTAGYKIFNAGTHEQTDLHNDTKGNGFVVSIDKSGAVSTVKARTYVSGKIHFYDLEVRVKPDSDSSLADALNEALAHCNENDVIRVKVSGSVKQSEYQNKEKIYKDVFGKCLTYEKDDSELSEEITIDKIRTEYAETSFAAKFMEEFMDNSTELQMVYQMLKDCREN